MEINKFYISYSVECIICGESITLNDKEVMFIRHGHTLQPKICDKCKNAVLYIRNNIDNINNFDGSTVTGKNNETTIKPCDKCFHKKWGDPECRDCNSDNDYRYFQEL